MKLISWNVNGLSACHDQRVYGCVRAVWTRIFSACRRRSFLRGSWTLELPGYHQYWNYAEKKGYSGTAMFTKEEPVCAAYGHWNRGARP